ncbi:MAG: cytochrome c oxidase assembly protein [Rickettsiales bacterium]|nr:cytochrome c oxidase assembly protein [Rickettsiales bacterium]|tara:strand:+ start:731 stop:1264 length:534 start_codon:yes stop_codon:yes gene_type:complete
MRKKIKLQVFYLASFSIFMLFLSYASVPLYKLFCQVTGYGGTPKINSVNTVSGVDSGKITIRFDSTIEKDSGIYFEPANITTQVQIGENNLAFFLAENKTNKTLKTMSTFNVTPLQAGKYFNKIECFCFEEQYFSPGESLEMPVSYFIDPSIKDDKFIGNLQELTLSYTMFVEKENE